jgi:hypothetical protein
MRWSLLLLLPLLCWADLSYQVECHLGSESAEPSPSCTYSYAEQGTKTVRRFGHSTVFADAKTGEKFTLVHQGKKLLRGQGNSLFSWEVTPALSEEAILGTRSVEGTILSGKLLLRQSGMSFVREEVWSNPDGIVMERRITIRVMPPGSEQRYPWDERDPIGFRDSLLYPETKIFLQTKKISRDPIAPREFAIPEGYAEETARN